MKKDKPKLYIASCSFGKDSIATILLALENNEPLDRVVFSEVMFDHKRKITGEIPENVQWIKEVAIPKLESYGLKVDIVKAKEDYVSVCSRKFKAPKPNGTIYYGIQNSRPCYANTYLKLEPIKQYYKKIGKDYDIIQYVGIASDEPTRLRRLQGTNKISLLDKYGYTEAMAMEKCKEYGISYKYIAKRLGVCLQKAFNVVKFAIEKGFLNKFNRQKQEFAYRIGCTSKYEENKDYTFCTLNNKYTILANVYSIGSVCYPIG